MSVYPPPEAYGELYDGISRVLISAEMLQQRVSELGTQISNDYRNLSDTPPLLIGVLKGVFPFMADLLRQLTIPIEVDFIAIASYSPAARDKGFVQIQKDLEEPIEGRHILFIEDMIDSGLTLNYLLRTLQTRKPASIKVCTMFNKPEKQLVAPIIHYKGFDLPDKFVVGYGLDYRERYRNLPFVGLLKPDVFNPTTP